VAEALVIHPRGMRTGTGATRFVRDGKESPVNQRHGDMGGGRPTASRSIGKEFRALRGGSNCERKG